MAIYFIRAEKKKKENMEEGKAHLGTWSQPFQEYTSTRASQ